MLDKKDMQPLRKIRETHMYEKDNEPTEYTEQEMRNIHGLES